MLVLPDEYNIVSQMQVIDREVFFYLAQRTDKHSGLVGDRCHVSYGGMALDLSERMSPGRRSSLIVFSSTDIRNSVQRLVEVGLLRRESGDRKGCRLMLVRVFFEQWRQRDRSEQKQVSRRLVGGCHDVSSVNNLKNNILPKDKDDRLRKYSGEVSTTSNNLLLHQGTEKEFSMRLDWKPNESDLQTILMMAGGASYALDKVDQAWVTNFITYWWGRSDRKLSERQWVYKLAVEIIEYFRKPGLFERRRGSRVLDEKEQQYVEKNSRSLPQWARPPRDDGALVGWMQANGYGDAPQGYDYQQTRGWLRREIDKRMVDKGLPKIAH